MEWWRETLSILLWNLAFEPSSYWRETLSTLLYESGGLVKLGDSSQFKEPTERWRTLKQEGSIYRKVHGPSSTTASHSLSSDFLLNY